MKRGSVYKLLAAPAVLALLLLLVTSASAKVLFRAGSGGELSLAQLLEALKGARIIVFGEDHNSPDDHQAQRTLLQALNDSGIDVALGLEMFRVDAQPKLDKWISGELGEHEFATLFSNHWNGDWYAMYHGLFYYARQERIPLVGLNIHSDIVRKVSRYGYDALDEAEKEQLGVLTCDVDDSYKDILGRAIGSAKAPEEFFERFCQAQLAWDVAMARSALAYLEQNERRVLMILAGNYHAWKHGIPEQISRMSDARVMVILPADDETFENYEALSDDADYIWMIE